METKTKAKYLMHTTDNCPYCKKAKKLFEYYEASVEYVNEKSLDWPTFPAIYIIDESGNKLIGGFAELVIYSQRHGL